MIDVSITGSEEIAIDFQDRPQAVSKALVRALNRGIKSGRTYMARALADDMGIKVSAGREAVVLQEASLSHPVARMAASKKRIPLIEFGAKGPMPSMGKGKGVTYKLKGGAGRLPHAFIAQMKSGHIGVFERHASKKMKARSNRPAITEKRGPSAGRVFAKYRDGAIAATLESFRKNFKSELRFATTGEGGSGASAE